jgi:hypothetical protein
VSSRGGHASGHVRRPRTVSLLWLVALIGGVLGAGTAIGTNVSGTVLAGYGFVLALLGASAAVAVRRAASARPEEAPRAREKGS